MSMGWSDFSARALQFPVRLPLQKLCWGLVNLTRVKSVVFGAVVCGFFVSFSATSSAEIPGHVAVNTVNYNVAGIVSTYHGRETPTYRGGSLNGSDLRKTFGFTSVDPDDEADYPENPGVN